MERALIVSIHDVAPTTQALVEQILAQLAQHRVEICSLLVVPDYHHHGASLDCVPFRDWLSDLNARGHEIVVHGFHHRRARSEGESFAKKMVTRFYTADEGEFYDIAYKDALEWLRRARQEFVSHGFLPTGFIAPAWLLGHDAERAVKAAGFTYTTTLRQVRDFVRMQNHASQSLVYSVRSKWRRVMSLAWNRVLFRRLSNNPLVRLAIHPPDFEHPEIWEQILQLLNEGTDSRQPSTYQSWLAQEKPILIR